MRLLKLPIKLIALPLVLATSLLQSVSILLVSVSTTFLNMILGVVSVVVLESWMLGLTSQGNVVCGLTLCFVLFVLPHLAKWLVIRIAVCNVLLKEFIRS